VLIVLPLIPKVRKKVESVADETPT
jgi:hypothetical protein